MLRINGTQVAEPAHEGVEITDEPIWSSNTGRSQTGKLTGDIVAMKTTIAVSWPPLSFAQSKQLRDTIVNAGEFFTLEYNDFSGSTTVTKTVYASSLPRTLYSIAPGIQLHTGISVTFIEQ